MNIYKRPLGGPDRAWTKTQLNNSGETQKHSPFSLMETRMIENPHIHTFNACQSILQNRGEAQPTLLLVFLTKSKNSTYTNKQHKKTLFSLQGDFKNTVN